MQILFHLLFVSVKSDTWASIDSALLEGLRGLQGNSSLPKLLQERLGVKNHMNLPKYSKEQIFYWIKQYFAKYKKYPNRATGKIEFAKDKYKSDTWASVDVALRRGTRGLIEGSS
ncbi:MAG: hypothetical protein ABIJ05_02080, partial [Patescibacteria group bacterium]